MSARLETYHSHKVVRAGKIRSVARGKDKANPGSVYLTLENGDTIHETAGYAEKHDPRAGGYYVMYPDGYTSWSPASAFEQGYTQSQDDAAETIDQIARLAHEINRAYCESIGDDSQPPWESAPDWQKDSARAGVLFHLQGDHPPSASHENWMAQKQADGWVYGETKDAEAKTHPCMVPYEQLPQEQRAKDYLFRGLVKAAGAEL